MADKETAVRAIRVELFGFGRASGQKDNWHELTRLCQRMTNRLWQIWLVHHAQNNSADLLRKHFAAFNEWKVTKQGKKPEWPVKAIEPPLTVSADKRSFYRIMSAEFPEVNVRTRGLLQNKWQQTVSTRKSTSGSLPGWVSILFALESLPSFTRPQPIPFDKENAKLITRDGKVYVQVRIERMPDGKSVVEDCEMTLNRRKTATQRAIVDKIMSGEYSWKGSSLSYDRGKWYANLSYAMPTRSLSGLDAGRVLHLIPGKRVPWVVMIAEGGKRPRRFRFGGNGRHVIYRRQQLLRERCSRKQHYRWSGSNQKGHGRGRALEVWTKLSSRWRDFSKTYNREVVARLLRLCERDGIGRIIYHQPKDSQRDKTFLARAGNSPGSAMVWEFFQVGTMLAQKCNVVGIEYETATTATPVAKEDRKPVSKLRAAVRGQSKGSANWKAACVR